MSRRARRFGRCSPRGRSARLNSMLPFSAAEAAIRLPSVAVYLSTNGVSVTGGTLVTAWAPFGGGKASVYGTFTPVADANRPTYNPTGGTGSRPRIEFNGTTHGLRVAAVTIGSTHGSFEIGLVGNVTATGAGVDQFLGYGTGASIRYSITSSATAGQMDMTTTGAGGLTSVCTSAESLLRHWSFNWSGTSQNARVTGVVEDTDAANPAAYADGSAAFLGARSDAATNTAANVQAFYFSTRELTAAERTYLRALLSFHTGVAS